MKLEKGKNYNENYLAKVVKLSSFVPHPDPEVNKLKVAIVDGYRVIVGIDEKPGLFIYFPAMSQINPELLRFANLYRHPEKNNSSDKSGLFEDNGRVVAIKLRGQVSEGFLLPVETFISWCIDSVNKEPEIKVGTEFDIVKDGDKFFWVCKKYYKKFNGKGKSRSGGTKLRGKVPERLFDKIIPTQFRFHYQTVLLRKCPHVIHPDDLISITAKVNGTSGISAYVLCKKQLNWKEKIAKWLTGATFDEYDYIYSSRTVIKNQYINKNAGPGYYGVDIWKYADDIVRPLLDRGMTAYYEILGYLPNGKGIQGNFDYGFVPPEEGETFTYGKHFGVQIYRVTLTNTLGHVHEFSPREVQEWCKNNGLKPVEEYYYGYAKELYPDIPQDDNWTTEFLEHLAGDKRFYMEELSPTCINQVPHEGIVIKIDNMFSEAFKLKCFKYINREQKALDKGEVDIESEN